MTAHTVFEASPVVSEAPAANGIPGRSARPRRSLAELVAGPRPAPGLAARVLGDDGSALAVSAFNSSI
jgi:hypothetical protein